MAARPRRRERGAASRRRSLRAADATDSEPAGCKVREGGQACAAVTGGTTFQGERDVALSEIPTREHRGRAAALGPLPRGLQEASRSPRRPELGGGAGRTSGAHGLRRSARPPRLAAPRRLRGHGGGPAPGREPGGAPGVGAQARPRRPRELHAPSRGAAPPPGASGPRVPAGGLPHALAVVSGPGVPASASGPPGIIGFGGDGALGKKRTEAGGSRARPRTRRGTK